MPVLILIIGAVAVFVVLGKKSTTTGQTQTQLEAAAFNAGQSGQTAVVRPEYGQPQLTKYQAIQVQQFQQLSVIASSGALSVAALLGASAAATAGIGAIVAAAVIAFGALRGTAHLVANEWTDPVNGVQKKFERALSAIVDEKDRTLRDGSASKGSVHYAKLAVESLYRQYKVAGEQFAVMDKDHRIVINNSYRKLDPIIAQITSDMAGQIASLAY